MLQINLLFIATKNVSLAMPHSLALTSGQIVNEYTFSSQGPCFFSFSQVSHLRSCHKKKPQNN